jgi:hypothetical protein
MASRGSRTGPCARRTRRTFNCATTLAAVALCSAASAAAAPLETHGTDPLALGLSLEVLGPGGGPLGTPLPADGRRVTAEAVRRSLPTAWCGDERFTDFEPSLENGEYRHHAVYAIPADAPSRLPQLAAGFQNDAFQASALLEESYARSFRFDMGTSCGQQYLDITVVRLQATTAELQRRAASASGTVEAVVEGLDAAGFDVLAPGESSEAAETLSSSFIVWLDGPGPSACGQSTWYRDTGRYDGNPNNLGGKVAIIYRSGSGFCGSNALRHELGHTLGAVQPAAAHAKGGHCDDAVEDSMCLLGSPQRSTGEFGGVYFDYGNDDYWPAEGGPALDWWTADLSRFTCSVACNVPRGLEAEARVENAEPAPQVEPRRERRRRSYRIRLRGHGSARVTLRCRRDGRTVRILTRRLRLPALLRGRARCDTRPRARVRRLR